MLLPSQLVSYPVPRQPSSWQRQCQPSNHSWGMERQCRPYWVTPNLFLNFQLLFRTCSYSECVHSCNVRTHSNLIVYRRVIFLFNTFSFVLIRIEFVCYFVSMNVLVHSAKHTNLTRKLCDIHETYKVFYAHKHESNLFALATRSFWTCSKTTFSLAKCTRMDTKWLEWPGMTPRISLNGQFVLIWALIRHSATGA